MADNQTEHRLSASVGKSAFSSTTATFSVTRGPLSWNYFYIILAFALSIEGSIVQMLIIERPWNAVTYLFLCFITTYLTLWNGRTQNILVGWKNRYESRAR